MFATLQSNTLQGIIFAYTFTQSVLKIQLLAPTNCCGLFNIIQPRNIAYDDGDMTLNALEYIRCPTHHPTRQHKPIIFLSGWTSKL